MAKTVSTRKMDAFIGSNFKQAIKAAKPVENDFWCRCPEPIIGEMIEVGHSLDVYCRCGGCMQVG